MRSADDNAKQGEVALPWNCLIFHFKNFIMLSRAIAVQFCRIGVQMRQNDFRDFFSVEQLWIVPIDTIWVFLFFFFFFLERFISQMF